jgi:DNA-binding CsgD family transcriptional regulator
VPTAELTSREREIALLAAGGLSSKQIAGQLVVSVRTVDNHLRAVYRKLGVVGRGELRSVLRPSPSAAPQ